MNAPDPSVAMSVEQAIHELQEQLRRVSAGLHATHQELTTLRSMVDTRSRVGYLNARPVRKEERPELENLVISGERLRRSGARSA